MAVEEVQVLDLHLLWHFLSILRFVGLSLLCRDTRSALLKVSFSFSLPSQIPLSDGNKASVAEDEPLSLQQWEGAGNQTTISTGVSEVRHSLI